MMGNSPFLVVGVLIPKEQDSSYSGRDNDKAFIPGTTFRALTGDKYVNNFIYQPRPGDQLEEGDRGRPRRSSGRQKKFDPKDKEALSVWDTTEEFAFFDMFLPRLQPLPRDRRVVDARRRRHRRLEHHERRRRGADERDRHQDGARREQSFILRQFLLETLLITAIGGAIGFAISLAICAVFPKAGLTRVRRHPGGVAPGRRHDDGRPRDDRARRRLFPGPRRVAPRSGRGDEAVGASP